MPDEPAGPILVTRGGAEKERPVHILDFRLPPLSEAPADTRSDHAVITRLNGLAALAPADTTLLQHLGRTAERRPTRTELSAEGEIAPPRLLLEGWACYQRLLSDGRRQIIDFLLPGDLIGSLTAMAPRPNCAVVALTSVLVADARPVLRALESKNGPAQGLADAVKQLNYRDHTRLHNHVVRLGQQTAYQRLLHLMLEFHDRLNAIGLVTHNSFALPLTQEMLADFLGVSVVHINRTLQQIRREGLFEMRDGIVVLRQIELMQDLSDWAPIVYVPQAASA